MVVETVEKQPGAKSLARFKGDAGRNSKIFFNIYRSDLSILSTIKTWPFIH
jgi:hypothetical protein